jgi:broad specificity phosphatase PhoE
MGTVLFVSHPEVVVDPGIPVPRWRLADGGIRRMRAFAVAPALRGLASVWASRETKAIEAAGLLAGRFGLSVHVHEGLGENDRSATGFLPPEEFQRTADAFFADPEGSVRGWERAVDAQSRMAAAVNEVLDRSGEGDVAIVAHGGVGTLLLCLYRGVPISRAHDQPHEGHVWTFERETRTVLSGWRPIAPR